MTPLSFTVYIITSLADTARHYTGMTRLPVSERLAYHNAGNA